MSRTEESKSVHTTPVLMLRHGVTAWNRAGRIQGRTDIPLSPLAKATLGALRVPAAFEAHLWVASPLKRARETAALLGGAARVEPRLVEMDWGDWEGRTLPALRAHYGAEMRENERRGLDFRPPGGESPREVQRRVADWLADVARDGIAVTAVSHKGVIRALVALVTGWDMLGKPPLRLDWARAHLFSVAPGGSASLTRANIGLTRRSDEGERG